MWSSAAPMHARQLKRDNDVSRRVSRAVAFALLAWASMTACRKATEKTLGGDRPLDPESAVDRIKTTGKVRFGYRIDARPFSFEESGKAAGYAVDLCKTVAKSIVTQLDVPNLKVEWVPVTVDSWSDAVTQHRVDAYCSAVTETLERRKTVDFSLPIFPGGVAAIVRADSPEALKEVLLGLTDVNKATSASTARNAVRGQTFAVMKGTTAEQWLSERRNALDLDSKVLVVDGYAAGVRAVADGRASAFFGQIAMLRDVVRRDKDAASLAVVERMFTYEPVALAMQRDDDDFRLLVDRALSERFAAADFWATYTRWFGMPDPTDVVFYLWNTLPK